MVYSKLITLFIVLWWGAIAHAQDIAPIATITAPTSIEEQKASEQQATDTPHDSKKTIAFNFDDEDLVNIINFLAAKKAVNIILPQGDNAIKSKVTLHMDHQLNLDEAWNILQTLLSIAGFNMTINANGYVIVKEDGNVIREPMPIYIGVPFDKLPTKDQPIKYLYYLANIKVADAGDNELNGLLQNLLPSPAFFKIDVTTNALLIVAKSTDIKSVMHIIAQLDQVGFQEHMEMIKLRYANAKVVTDMFNEHILKSATDINRYRLDTRRGSEASYFSRHTRIIAEERTNSLIIVGRRQAIDRIKEFIYEYIDVKPESGKSILHVYQLQYLNAEQFEPVLKKIVESSRPGGTEQARAGEAPKGGPERFFDEVIIKVDKPADTETTKYYGGNKLIIAARNDDWERIKKLIEDLDKPQPQVLIEVLIADLTLDDTRILGSIIRNPAKLSLPNQINIQAAHLDAGIIPDSFTNPQTVGVIPNVASADLLRKAFDTIDNNCARNDAGPNSAASNCFITPGSTVISLNDTNGSTWNILQILKKYGNSKILSHPHILATHNKQAEIESAEIRLIRDDAAGSLGGTTVIKNIPFPAALKIKITPRISSADTVNLQIIIEIDEFLSATQNNKATRAVTTNINVNSKDIISLGGLIKTTNEHTTKKTPILGDIPILGYFFKNRTNSVKKTNLTVFISPTIIQPNLRKGVSEYTKEYIKLTDNYAQEGTLFDSLKDPISRWFFKTGNEAKEIIDDFLEKDETKNKLTEQNIEANQTASFDKKKSAQEIKELVQKDENPFKKPKKRAKAHLRS